MCQGGRHHLTKLVLNKSGSLRSARRNGEASHDRFSLGGGGLYTCIWFLSGFLTFLVGFLGFWVGFMGFPVSCLGSWGSWVSSLGSWASWLGSLGSWCSWGPWASLGFLRFLGCWSGSWGSCGCCLVWWVSWFGWVLGVPGWGSWALGVPVWILEIPGVLVWVPGVRGWALVLLGFLGFLFWALVFFEGVCLTPVILATVHGEGRLRAADRYVVLPGSAGSTGLPDEFQILQIMCAFAAKVTRVTLRCNVFLTFSYPSHLKHLFLRAFLEDGLPEMLSKLGVLAERGIKK